MRAMWVWMISSVWATVAAGALPADAPSPAAGGDWRASVRDFAKAHFRNPAWGYSHSVRDYDLARRLAAQDHVTLDDDVLFAAAYLHDMAAFKPWENEQADHADVAADLVADELRDTGFPMAKIEAVRSAIRTHMFGRDPVGAEARYLHDADALDWLGAIGVARVVALADPLGGAPDGPAVVRMLEDNLRQVPPRVLTPAGRRMLNGRREELRRFLGELRAESENLRAL